MIFPHPNCLRLALPAFRHTHIFRSSIFLIALLVFASSAYGQQPTPAKSFRLSSIEVKGLQRYSKEQAIAASGLQIGQRVDIATLDAAGERLASSGLFTNVSYRLHTNGGEATVTFEVEEAKGAGFPVVFDNFVWFTDEEIVSAVRRELPSFDGTAPESTGVINSITKALQQLLRERKIAGEVDYTPSADPAGRNVRHVFSVKGANIKICTLHFPGAANVQESDLVKKSKPLFEEEYSREFVSAFAIANLIPLYRERGHLRASFQSPAAKIEADSNSCKGVSIALPVEEGISYSWDKSEWAGNNAFSTQELEAALGMKSGERANGLKIDAGMMSVQKLYGKKGFLTARLNDEAVFDDAGKRVAYRISVTEGPQYRMGTLTITGLSESEANRLKEKWKLRQGEIFDASYLEEFGKKGIREYLENAFREGRIQPGSRPSNIQSSIKPNKQTLIVDVVFEFKK